MHLAINNIEKSKRIFRSVYNLPSNLIVLVKQFKWLILDILYNSAIRHSRPFFIPHLRKPKDLSLEGYRHRERPFSEKALYTSHDLSRLVRTDLDRGTNLQISLLREDGPLR